MQAAAYMGNTTQASYQGKLLSQELDLIKNAKAVFLTLLGNAMQIYDKELENQQQLLLALSNILIEIYMGESTVLRTLKIKSNKEIKKTAVIAMAQLQIIHGIDCIRNESKKILAALYQDEKQKKLNKVVEEKLAYSELPNSFALKTTIADDVIAANRYCF